METCACDILNKDIIHPLTTSVPSDFLVKKDWGWRHCIDYCGLSAITVKCSESRPLIPAALEQLRMAHIFTKLDLRSTYNLICIWAGDE